MSDRVPLDPHELQPIFKVYEVRVFVDQKTADIFRKLPIFKDAPDWTQSFLWSVHRVPPKKFFGLSRFEFPSAYQIEQADYESQRVAQRQAIELLKIEGVKRVTVSWSLRKATNSQYTPGQTVSGLVIEMTSTADRWIDGEPSELALAIDRGRT
jgi:hypothetical protein